jgi:NADH-quinone oxidoreductase subunit C
MQDTNSHLKEQIFNFLGEKITYIDTDIKDGILSIELLNTAYPLIQFLKDKQNFQFLTDLCGMHYPDQPEYKFGVVYHLHNWLENKRIRIKCLIKNEPKTESIVRLFESANWQERETYDFYGIEFINHPDLRRILNMDEMESFPLRKDHALEDAGRTDKDDRYFGRTSQNQ